MKVPSQAASPPAPDRPSVAVIGSGVSGLTAAYLLRRTHDVTLFEADDRLGGHAHTHTLKAFDGSRHAVDSGFIVHNDRTYPWLRKLFAELEVEVRPTEMSMSVRCEGCGLEYAGGRGLRGLLAQPRCILDPHFLRMLLPDVRRSSPVTDVSRRPEGVEIRDASGDVTRFDRVVIATHADQALGLLTDPSDEEVQTLKAFGYSRNETILHTDASLLPEATQARASWNYRMSSCSTPDGPTVVTYWMNRLQGHHSPEDYMVSLNARERVEPDAVLAVMGYEHPIFTPESVAAQSHLGSLATDQTVYAGAYHGWGFHEDGCRSGVEAAQHFGVTW